MELTKLQDITSDILNINREEIKLETEFIKDLGADSIDIFQIITALETEFDIEFDIERSDKIVTVADAVEEIKRLTSN